MSGNTLGQIAFVSFEEGISSKLVKIFLIAIDSRNTTSNPRPMGRFRNDFFYPKANDIQLIQLIKLLTMAIYLDGQSL